MNPPTPMVIAITEEVVTYVKVFATDIQCTILVWWRYLKHGAMSGEFTK